MSEVCVCGNLFESTFLFFGRLTHEEELDHRPCSDNSTHKYNT